MRLLISFFCVSSALFSWYERYNEHAKSPAGIDERLSEFDMNAFPFRNKHDLELMDSFAMIARINEGIRFGCPGAIVSKNVFATLVECDYHMFHYIKGSFPADDQMNYHSSVEEIAEKFQEMVDDGLIYIYYGATGMHDGKFIKVKSTKKMETHMFLTTVENFELERDPIKIADTEFFNKMIADSSDPENPTYQCLLFGFYRYESYFLSHPKQPHFHTIFLRINGREAGTNRPKMSINTIRKKSVGFLPTFEDYGTPIFCRKEHDETKRFKLAAFLDKTALKAIKQLDELRAEFSPRKNFKAYANKFRPMKDEFRVKRDTYEIFFALHDDSSNL